MKKNGNVFLFILILSAGFASFAATASQTNASMKSRILKSSSGDSMQTLLEKARNHYEKREFAQAIRVYKLIPTSSSIYLRTREELAWAYLQSGDWSSLRGILSHLNSPLIPLEQRLEGRVLASISGLHSCQFQEVKNEILQFQQELRPLVVNLDQRLKEASGKSNTVLLNKKALVSEAITKMRFVKVELMNELYRWERFKTKNNILVQSKQLEVKDDFDLKALEKLEESKLVFKSDGDIWPDELFKLKSFSPSECDDFQQAKSGTTHL